MKKLILLFAFVLPLITFAGNDSDSTANMPDTAAINFFQTQGITIDSASDSLYDFLYGWIGTPYHYAGNSKKGIDCSGLIKMIYEKFYHIQLSGSASNIYIEDCRKIKKKKLEQGDLVFFIIGRNKHISHVGMYLKNNKFIHASVHSGVTVSSLDEAYYKKYFYKAGRVKKSDK